MPNDGSLEVTTPNPNEIVLTRVFDAPWRLVYEAFTKPDLIRRWFGAKRGTMTVCEVDLRVGGKWRYVMRLPNGRDMGMYGVYKDLSPPERMVHTEAFDDFPGDSEITTRLVEAGGKTTLIATCRYSSQEVRDAVIRSGMEDGAAESQLRRNLWAKTELTPIPGRRHQTGARLLRGDARTHGRQPRIQRDLDGVRPARRRLFGAVQDQRHEAERERGRHHRVRGRRSRRAHCAPQGGRRDVPGRNDPLAGVPHGRDPRLRGQFDPAARAARKTLA